MKSILTTFVAGAFLIGSSACQNQNNTQTERLQEIADSLESIDKRLAVIERRAPAAGARQARPKVDPNKVHAIPVASDDPYLGAKHAKVTIVEASEFACPYCAMTSPVVEELVAAYPADLKVVFKQFVVHPQTATLPALAICAANRQGALEPYKKELWSRAWTFEGGRPSMNKEALGAEALLEIARDKGLDRARFEADLKGPECKKLIDRQRRELASAQVTGTPTFFVNGKRYMGARNTDGFKAVIDAEIARADKVIAGGVSLATYYEHVTKAAK